MRKNYIRKQSMLYFYSPNEEDENRPKPLEPDAGEAPWQPDPYEEPFDESLLFNHK